MKDTLNNQPGEQYKDYENWYFHHILNPRAREERQKILRKEGNVMRLPF